MDIALAELTGGQAARLLTGARGAPGPAEPSDDNGADSIGADGDNITLSKSAQAALAGDGASPNDDDPNPSHKQAESGAERGADGKSLSDSEQREVEHLKKRDQEVRAHEQAHKSAGGPFAGAPSYEYETGPDGKQYATSGEVKIDTAPIANDPRATIAKMETVKRAALAAAEPSAADRSVAASADQAIVKARRELHEQDEDADTAESSGSAQSARPPDSPAPTGSDSAETSGGGNARGNLVSLAV